MRHDAPAVGATEQTRDQPENKEVRPRKDRRGFDLISDRLSFGGLWYTKTAEAVGYAKFYLRSETAIIRVFDESGAVIETHEQAGDFKEW